MDFKGTLVIRAIVLVIKSRLMTADSRGGGFILTRRKFHMYYEPRGDVIGDITWVF